MNVAKHLCRWALIVAMFGAVATYNGSSYVAANTFMARPTVSRHVTASGTISGVATTATMFNLARSTLATGSSGDADTLLRAFAGNSNTTGQTNTGLGINALRSCTKGRSNRARGRDVLFFDTGGFGNRIHGYGAVFSNVTSSAPECSGVECGSPAMSR